MNKGLVIALEGIDGCGKTTRARDLKRFLTSVGYGVVTTREPGGTGVGMMLRKCMLKNDDVDPWTQTFLMMADRAWHWKEVVRPALERGDIVLTERCWFSTLAYQGFGGGVDVEMIVEMNKHYDVDLCLFLKTDTGDAVKRAGGGDVMERKGLEFFEKVVRGYEYAEKTFKNVKGVEWGGEHVVNEKIKNVVLEYIKNMNR